jgi:hypothetical protein
MAPDLEHGEGFLVISSVDVLEFNASADQHALKLLKIVHLNIPVINPIMYVSMPITMVALTYLSQTFGTYLCSSQPLPDGPQSPVVRTSCACCATQP